MMEQFILLKTLKDNYEDILVVLKQLLGNHITSEEFDNLLLVKSFVHDSKEIFETIKSLEIDLNTNISVYVTYPSVNPSEEIKLVYDMFSASEVGCYNLKGLLLNTKEVKNSVNILDFILNGSGIDEKIILALALNDLNVSKASTDLYMHRNTLLYKIDRLMELKNFDLKKFTDLYILFRLLKA